MSTKNLISTLQLWLSDNVGLSTFYRLLRRFKSAQAALEAIPELAAAGGLKSNVKICSPEKAERYLHKSQQQGIKCLTLEDHDYPDLLRKIKFAPPILWYRGRKELLNQPSMVGIVGKRDPSISGFNLARNIAAELGKANINVVSGLAKGIDTAAHIGSLQSGSIAVVANGLDIYYPKQNEEMQLQLERYGCLVSENVMGTRPKHFLARNRIIAGLVKGVLVVEAEVNSGSLSTAYFAIDYGREVFAIPGSPAYLGSRGCNLLLKSGATLVETAHDIIANLSLESGKVAASYTSPESISEPGFPASCEINPVLRQRLISFLEHNKASFSNLMNMDDTSDHSVDLTLLSLELVGLVEINLFDQVSLKTTRPQLFD